MRWAAGLDVRSGLVKGPMAAVGGDGVIRVMVVDDHRLVRAGLRALLADAEDVEVVAEAADGAEAVATVAAAAPDVVLMDLSMPLLDGVAATRAIRGRNPRSGCWC